MKVVAVGSTVFEMFDITEATAEAFEAGMKESGWEYNMDHAAMERKIDRKIEKYSYTETQRVGITNVCIETEMSYRDYKNNYSSCQTKKNSYNKETKTITVYVPAY